MGTMSRRHQNGVPGGGGWREEGREKTNENKGREKTYKNEGGDKNYENEGRQKINENDGGDNIFLHLNQFIFL